MIRAAAVEVALGCAALGAVICAIGATALVLEYFDRKRRGDQIGRAHV